MKVSFVLIGFFMAIASVAMAGGRTIVRADPASRLVHTPGGCRNQVVQVRNYPAMEVETYDPGRATLGLVAGGALGHQIGRGGGKDWATIVGALAGSSVAGTRRQAVPAHTETDYQAICTLDQEHYVNGYNVLYSDGTTGWVPQTPGQ